MFSVNPETVPVEHEDLGQPKAVTHEDVTAAIAAFKRSGQRVRRLPTQRISTTHANWFQRQAKREEAQRRHELLHLDEGRTFERDEADDMDAVERGAHNHISTEHCAVCEAREKAAQIAAAIY